MFKIEDDNKIKWGNVALRHNHDNIATKRSTNPVSTKHLYKIVQCWSNDEDIGPTLYKMLYKCLVFASRDNVLLLSNYCKCSLWCTVQYIALQTSFLWTVWSTVYILEDKHPTRSGFELSASEFRTTTGPNEALWPAWQHASWFKTKAWLIFRRWYIKCQKQKLYILNHKKNLSYRLSIEMLILQTQNNCINVIQFFCVCWSVAIPFPVLILMDYT